MKFAEALDENLVSEWRDQYVKYRSGKRLIKAIQRVMNRNHGIVDARNILSRSSGLHLPNALHRKDEQGTEDTTPLRTREAEMSETQLSRQASDDSAQSPGNDPYDSVHSQGNSPPLFAGEQQRAASNNNDVDESSQDATESRSDSQDQARPSLRPLAIPSERTLPPFGRLPSDIARDRALDTPRPGGLNRFSSGFGFTRVATNAIDIKMHPVDMLDLRRQEFFHFMDLELQKVENFFNQKEQEAGLRLKALREQLHIMRQRRNQQVDVPRKFSLRTQKSNELEKKRSRIRSMLMGKTADSKALQPQPFTPATPTVKVQAINRDFARRPSDDDKVSYRHAKHKLRIAVQELYRSLELLKSYALLNRTAFRKLNKKYDKAVTPDSGAILDWFHDKIDSSYFVNSKLVDEYIETLEDLCARYLERGNRKLAVEKLRQITQPKGDKSGSALLNGLMVGIGFTFAVEGAIHGVYMLDDENGELAAQTAYLLQIYAGYFLMLYLFAWFCFNCRTWTKHKVNYPFVFEFDPRHDLDWRQLSNFPCFFMLLFGIMLWLNFSRGRNDDFYVWYPVILIGVSLLIILLPLPIFRWRARKWFAIAHWRLLLSGLYPVEFRDLFLGDIYTSLTYSIVNTEIFFCLYARKWDDPIRCGSRYSKLVGFVAVIPYLWRALQCIRRFWDSKHAFPHLANLLKYALSIAASIALSLYRLDNDPLELSLFIAFGSISACYSATWDVFMDFSFIQGGPYPGLRQTLAFNSPYLYYGILIVDPILRFSFVLQAIFTHDIQHGSYVAFAVAFIEATRRGMWALFRVENEHCSNIKTQKASRETPLPYSITSSPKEADGQDGSTFALLSMRTASGHDHISNTVLEAEGIVPRERHNILRGISRRMGAAHTEDFQKRKDAPTIEEAEEPQGLEEALLDDEGSDNEIEDISITSQQSSRHSSSSGRESIETAVESRPPQQRRERL